MSVQPTAGDLEQGGDFRNGQQRVHYRVPRFCRCSLTRSTSERKTSRYPPVVLAAMILPSLSSSITRCCDKPSSRATSPLINRGSCVRSFSLCTSFGFIWAED